MPGCNTSLGSGNVPSAEPAPVAEDKPAPAPEADDIPDDAARAEPIDDADITRELKAQPRKPALKNGPKQG